MATTDEDDDVGREVFRSGGGGLEGMYPLVLIGFCRGNDNIC